MASVERVVEYSNMPEEGDYLNEKNLPKSWPSASGEIEVKNLSFKYRPELSLVLDDISFTVAAGERIGIVGRTGAGKSSITVALFRLAEAEKGS